MKIEKVVKNNLCIGCGICTVYNGNGKMIYSKKNGVNIPDPISQKTFSADTELYCPGAGDDLKQETELEKIIFGKKYISSYVVQTNLHRTKAGFSSSGIISIIAYELLKTKTIDLVLTAKFKLSDKVRTNGVFISDPEKIWDVVGSKYSAVDYSKTFENTNLTGKKILIISTPCLSKNLKDLLYSRGARDVIILNNFCGGFKSYNSTDYLIKKFGDISKKINHFQFRGDGQPGFMKIQYNNHTTKHRYPDYVKENGFSKMKRCTLCSDAFGEHSDFSFGDAWGLEKYFPISNSPASSVIIRTKKGMNLFNSVLSNSDNIYVKKINLKQLEKSQRGLISTKKIRQFSRIKAYRLLGFEVPNINNYVLNKTSIFNELKIISSHKFNNLLQFIGLYNYIRNNKFISKVFSKISKNFYE